MVLIATLRTFEMVLAVSLTRWSSRQKPNDKEVLILTIEKIGVHVYTRIHWIEIEDQYLREYASGQ